MLSIDQYQPPPRAEPAQTADLVAYIDNFQHRVLQDAVNEATATYWLRRGTSFTNAAPRPGDFTGHATPAALDDQRARLAAVAQACRNKATLALIQDGAP